MSDGVISRTGTTLFYNPSVLNLKNAMTGAKTGTTILVTNTNGYTFSQDDVGRYFRGSDGMWDIITAVSVVCGTVLTVARSSNYTSFISCALRGEISCMEWVTILGKWVIQIDTRLFLCSWDFSTVTQVYFCGTPSQIINESKTKVGYKKGMVVLFNSNGMYGINTSKSLPYYYKMNAVGPQSRTADVLASAYHVYGRRYLTTYSILDAVGNKSDTDGNINQVTRITPGVKIEHESCPNILKETVVLNTGVAGGTQLIDYSEVWNPIIIGDYNPIMLNGNYIDLYAPTDPHWLYHSVWATMDIGVNGVALNNNSERYYYVKDVLVTKAFTVHSDPSNKTHIIADSGTFSTDDYGSKLLLEFPIDGISEYTILYMINSTTVVVLERSAGSLNFNKMGASIGSAKVSTGQTWVTNDTILIDPFGSLFDATDVGKILFWDDGTWDIIIQYVNTRTVKILNNNNISRTNATQGVAWVAANRKFNDNVADTILATRAGYLLPHRFFTPMPNCDMGIVVPGYVAEAQSNSNMLYYCQTLYSQHIGYYNEGLQYDEVDSDIAELSEFPNYLIAYGTHEAGWAWPLNASQVVSDQSENAVGESISILGSRAILSGKFGVIPGSVAKDENGNDILLDTEKELIVFDGTKFGQNLLSERIMNRVSKLQNAVAARYDTFNGYIFEGTEDAVNS
jgi:hypothetical protein